MTKNYSTGQILKIARNQKGIIWCVLANLLLILVVVFAPVTQVYIPLEILRIFPLLVIPFQLFFVYRLASSLEMAIIPLWWCIGMLIPMPLLSVLLLLILNEKATKAIKERGFKVGLMGANIKEIETSTSR